MALLVMGAGALLRLLEAIPAIRRQSQRLQDAVWAAVRDAGFTRPAVLAQSLAGFGIITVASICWMHADLCRAWAASFNSAPLAVLQPMNENSTERNDYQNELSIVLGATVYSLFKLKQIRQRQRTDEGRGGMIGLLCVAAIATLLIDLPYRTFRYREFERADFHDQHCYVTGENAGDLLVLCPGNAPPRNQIVNKGDPSLRQLGTSENVFRGFPTR
jgi:hypothetical protein